MKLFNKDKELIFKIVNGVLLLWLVGALAFAANNIINILLPEPSNKKNYEEYKTLYCPKEDTEEFCKARFKEEESAKENQQYYNKTSLLASLANVIIVSGAMFFLNMNSQPTKKENK